MVKFYYKGKNLQGKIITGFYEAENKSDVAFALKQRGFFPYFIEPNTRYNLTLFFKNLLYNTRATDLAIFCRQFAALLDSGIPIIIIFSILQKQSSGGYLSGAIKDIAEELKRGLSISSGFKKHPEVFSDLFVYMIEIGEYSGNLSEVLTKLADYYERMSYQNERIKTAMIYPTILCVTSILAVSILINKVVPAFANMFYESGVQLPLLTRFFINFVYDIKKYCLFLIAIMFALIYGCYCFKRTKSGAIRVDKLILNLPTIGGLQKKIISANICATLSILVSSGIPLIKALEICKSCLSNRVYKNAMENAKYGLKKGQDLHKVLDPQLFPAIMIRMIGIGEETGNLENLLKKTTSIFEREVQVIQEKLVALIEPSMIIFLAIIIGFIVISIVLPMFEIYSFY